MDKKIALEKCMHICSQREYCTFDIKEKLLKWEVPKIDHDEILSRLTDDKFIDHKRYTSAFVNDKFRFNHWGKNKISFSLKQKDIEQEIIKLYIDAIDDTAYLQAISNEINKKRHSVKGKDDFEKNQKIARYVISKGFEPDKVFSLINFP